MLQEIAEQPAALEKTIAEERQKFGRLARSLKQREIDLIVLVARGSMPYSAVTHPLPLLRRNGGTRSSTLAVQMTFVLPA